MKENISKIVSWLFTACVFIFMILGVLLVAGQMAGVIMKNGVLCLAINNAFKLWMIRVAVIAGILGFIKGYLKPA